MPTSADYEAWATELDGLADDLNGALDPFLTAWQAGPVIGDQLGVIVYRAVEAASDHVSGTGNELARLRDECHRRADVCAQYTEALSRYNADYARYLDDLGALADGGGERNPIPPERPARPAPWVEASPGTGGGS